MKTKEQFRMLFVAFLVVAGLMACSDDDTSYHLELQETSCEVMLNGSKHVEILAGKDVTLEVADEELIEAVYQWGYLVNGLFDGVDEPLPGIVTFKSKGKKGETVVRITDHAIGETVTIGIKVVDAYLPVNINESNHPALTNETSFFLVRNEQHDCYFFRTDHMTHQAVLCGRGTYEFSVEKEGEAFIPYLILNYVSDLEGKFSIVSLPPVAHKFCLTGTLSEVYELIEYRLGVDWNTLVQEARTSPLINMTMVMKESDTEYEIKGEVTQGTMPQGILE